MTVTYYGHSCFSIEVNGMKLLLDPFITPNPLAKGKVDAGAVEADFILVTHGHEDHVADLIPIAKRTKAKVISNFEIVSWLEDQGIENVHPLNHGGKARFNFGNLKYVSAIHSSVLPDGAYGGNPGGFIIDTPEKCVYYAGDTALTLDMQLIPKSYNIDCAFLPIGDNFTMGADDAVVAAEFVNCKSVIGMHYDTFPYIEIDGEEAKAKFKKAGANLALMEIGETIEI
ncbi:MAG: metal-dependent hydrolase [Cryomorphaceae bacterium]|nr:metal-dependent hydrolase [Flavobacteriales bacterium]